MELEQWRIYFKTPITKEEAEQLVRKYSPKSSLGSFQKDIQVGCNTHTFGIAELDVEIARKLDKDSAVTRIEFVSGR